MPHWKFLVLIICLAGLIACAKAPEEPLKKTFEQPETGVFGLITADPEESGFASTWVYAYRSQTQGLRGPAEFAARVERDGRYVLDLPAGRWFLVARARQQGERGAPQSGDADAVYAANPLVLAAGEVQRVDLRLQSSAAPRKPPGISIAASGTGFRGRLVRADRLSANELLVVAYRDDQAARRPQYMTQVSADDGRFVLWVTIPGRYCLIVRQGLRGQPRPGELVGKLGHGAAGCREVSPGEVMDVGEIHLKPFLR